jgi:glucose-1-phosphate thymidylyltransferase
VSTRFVGILPAAGEARRLRPFRYPKELLPIAFAPHGEGGKVRPIPVAEYSLRAFQVAGIRHCLMIVADWKTELMRYFGDGSELGLHIAYVNQSEARGLSDAVDMALDWAESFNICLALPDTVFEPSDACRRICAHLTERGCDLVLGVFPTDRPQHLGPVRIGPRGEVLEVLDKPATTDLLNTWGLAAWSARFTDLLRAALSADEGARQRPLGYYFNLAVASQLRVEAICFDSGRYIDVGMAEGIGTLLLSEMVVP